MNCTTPILTENNSPQKGVLICKDCTTRTFWICFKQDFQSVGICIESKKQHYLSTRHTHSQSHNYYTNNHTHNGLPCTATQIVKRSFQVGSWLSTENLIDFNLESKLSKQEMENWFDRFFCSCNEAIWSYDLLNC